MSLLIIIIFSNSAMAKIRIILMMIFMFIVLPAFSQQNEHEIKRLSHFSFSVGTGWTHYINNLDYGAEKISQDFAGISSQFFWEPEYRLSLGMETGYYKLFEFNEELTYNITSEVDRTVIPIMLLFRMRIVDNFYISTGFGLAMVNNITLGESTKVLTKTWSLSNYQAVAAYIYPLNAHLRIGGEMKIFHFESLNDWMYSLQAQFAVKF